MDLTVDVSPPTSPPARAASVARGRSKIIQHIRSHRHRQTRSACACQIHVSVSAPQPGGASTASVDADSRLRGLPAPLWRTKADPHHRGDNGPAHGARPFEGSLVYVHTVIRWMPKLRDMETTLSPFDRAVRIASTRLSVGRVPARLQGFATTSGSSSAAPCGPSPTPSFACSHAEPSRSNRCQVFGLSPPAFTSQKARSVWTGPSSSRRRARRRDLPAPSRGHDTPRAACVDSVS